MTRPHSLESAGTPDRLGVRGAVPVGLPCAVPESLDPPGGGDRGRVPSLYALCALLGGVLLWGCESDPGGLLDPSITSIGFVNMTVLSRLAGSELSRSAGTMSRSQAR